MRSRPSRPMACASPTCTRRSRANSRKSWLSRSARMRPSVVNHKTSPRRGTTSRARRRGPLTWKVKDGTQIEGWVMKPLGYTAGKKYPMILKIHGGPYGAYGTNWFDQFQMLSASGFFVLFTNPRGSTGYGHAYQWATRGKW